VKAHKNRGRAGVLRSSLVWLYVLGGKGECEMFVKKKCAVSTVESVQGEEKIIMVSVQG
jgi:hypothetical protein